MNRSPAPPGALQEVGVELIQEGQFQAQVNSAMRKAISDLRDYEKDTGDLGGTAQVAIVIKMGRLKGSANSFQIDTQITTKIPIQTKTSVAMERNGRLLCQPIGTNEDPAQQVFYDNAGRPICNGNGEVDVIDAPPVAGRIAKAAHG